MMPNNSYIILPDLKLIIESYSDKTTINDALELKEKEINDLYYDSSFNFIILFVNFTIPIKTDTESEINKYIDSIKSNKKILGNRKSAILTEKPNQVVLGNFYEMATKELPMNFKIFSTIRSALNWIGIPNEYEQIVAKHIEILKNNAT
jgi:hypothetical protein